MEACTIELNRDSNATQKAFSRNWKACASCCSFVVCLAHVQGSWYRSYTLPVSFLSCDALFALFIFPFHTEAHMCSFDYETTESKNRILIKRTLERSAVAQFGD